MIKKHSRQNVPAINDIVCTYETKKIRAEIQDMFEVNKEFNLPNKYTYEIKPSGFSGHVAKIVKRK